MNIYLFTFLSVVRYSNLIVIETWGGEYESVI